LLEGFFIPFREGQFTGDPAGMQVNSPVKADDAAFEI